MGKYSWEIRECWGKTQAGPFQNTRIRLEAAQGFHITPPLHNLESEFYVEKLGVMGQAAMNWL